MSPTGRLRECAADGSSPVACRDEIGILFTEDDSETNVESAFVLEDHKLGVVFAVAPRLFREARDQFYICNDVFKRNGSGAEDDEEQEQTRSQLQLCTRVLLLLNGDFYTAWNTRYARSCLTTSGSASH